MTSFPPSASSATESGAPLRSSAATLAAKLRTSATASPSAPPGAGRRPSRARGRAGPARARPTRANASFPRGRRFPPDGPLSSSPQRPPERATTPVASRFGRRSSTTACMASSGGSTWRSAAIRSRRQRSRSSSGTAPRQRREGLGGDGERVPDPGGRQGGEARQHDREEPGGRERGDPGGGVGPDEQPRQLLRHPLPGDQRHHRQRLGDGVAGLRGEPEPELGDEARAPQRAEAVLGEALARVAHRPDELPGEVGPATERVAQLALERVPGHGVHGEVAARQVGLEVVVEGDPARAGVRPRRPPPRGRWSPRRAPRPRRPSRFRGRSRSGSPSGRAPAPPPEWPASPRRTRPDRGGSGRGAGRAPRPRPARSGGRHPTASGARPAPASGRRRGGVPGFPGLPSWTTQSRKAGGVQSPGPDILPGMRDAGARRREP